jgi:hypothetical protein
MSYRHEHDADGRIVGGIWNEDPMHPNSWRYEFDASGLIAACTYANDPSHRLSYRNEREANGMITACTYANDPANPESYRNERNAEGRVISAIHANDPEHPYSWGTNIEPVATKETKMTCYNSQSLARYEREVVEHNRQIDEEHEEWVANHGRFLIGMVQAWDVIRPVFDLKWPGGIPRAVAFQLIDTLERMAIACGCDDLEAGFEYVNEDHVMCWGEGETPSAATLAAELDLLWSEYAPSMPESYDSDARPWCSEADTARMSNAWSGEL